MNLIFRDLTKEDIPSLSWAGDQTHLEYIKDALSKSEEGQVELVVGELDKEIVVKGGIDYEKYPGSATIWMVNVHEDHQRKGIGTLFFAELERRATNKGITSLRLHVEKKNSDAQKLYLKLGYEIVGDVTDSWNETDDQGNSFVYVADCVLMERNIT